MKIKITLLFNTHSNIFHTACLKYFKAACYVYGYCEIEKESGRNMYFIVTGKNAQGKHEMARYF